MNPKLKILLHSLSRDISRGIYTPEQASVAFKKSTGQELYDVLDQAGPEVGEFLAFLEGAYKLPEVDLAALPADFLATDPETQITAQELVALVQPESPADPEQLAETQPDPEAEQAPEAPKSDAPAVPVHQLKRTRQSAKKPA